MIGKASYIPGLVPSVSGTMGSTRQILLMWLHASVLGDKTLIKPRYLADRGSLSTQVGGLCVLGAWGEGRDGVGWGGVGWGGGDFGSRVRVWKETSEI